LSHEVTEFNNSFIISRPSRQKESIKAERTRVRQAGMISIY
uniref:KID domain-containing protein n=1 Tax=Hymenolepis diminuta TaxID=6216 RepID=A0A0R3SUT0_HYMDI